MRKYFTQKYSNFVETVKNRDMQAQERRNKTSGEEKFRNGKQGEKFLSTKAFYMFDSLS